MEEDQDLEEQNQNQKVKMESVWMTLGVVWLIIGIIMELVEDFENIENLKAVRDHAHINHDTTALFVFTILMTISLVLMTIYSICGICCSYALKQRSQIESNSFLTH